MLSPAAAGMASVGGSALLAFWMVARHRGLGPQTLPWALVACGIALALLRAMRPLLVWVLGTTNGAVGLLVVVVPIFGFAFWSGGVVLRAFLGGPSEPVRARAEDRKRR